MMLAHRDVIRRYTILFLILAIMTVLLACGFSAETPEPTINAPTEVPSPNGDDEPPDRGTTIEPTEEIPSTEVPRSDLSGDDQRDNVTTPESSDDAGGGGEKNASPYIDLDAPAGRFSIEDAQHTIPEDVFQEVNYGGTGGGFEYVCGNPPPSVGNLNFHFYGDEEEQANNKLGLNVEWLGYPYADCLVSGCGWQPYERVLLTIKSIAGDIVYTEVYTAEPDMTYITYDSRDDAIFPVSGLYTITYESLSGWSSGGFDTVQITHSDESHIHKHYNTFQPGEQYRLIAESVNDNIVREKIVTAQPGSGYVILCFGRVPLFPIINTPSGTYTFSLEGTSGRLQHTVRVSIPTEPRVYRYDEKLILYGFQPNERVRVFQYQYTNIEGSIYSYLLDGWDGFFVNHQGQLVLDLEGTVSEKSFIAVVGDLSGPVEGEVVLLSFPIIQTVRNYYTYLDKRDMYDASDDHEFYSSNWARLSDHFKEKFNCCTQSGDYDFNGYLDWWRKVRSVNIGEIRVVEQDHNMATVHVQLSYVLDDGRTIEDPKPYIQLMWDEDTNQWLFYDKW